MRLTVQLLAAWIVSISVGGAYAGVTYLESQSMPASYTAR